jgi:ATP-dependent RNA helicase SUPV3L1/SUV3
VVAVKGKDSVALITGEEKILPDKARWFLCTAESMPLDREFAFVALDERSSAAIPSAAMSSPIDCCARGAARRR